MLAATIAGALLVFGAFGAARADNSGSRVAFRGWPYSGIFTMNPYDPLSMVSFAADGEYYRPTLSPLGDRLAMFRRTPPIYELVLYDHVGNELETLMGNLKGAGFIDWSPDGREIAYTHHEQTAGQGTVDIDDDVVISSIRAIDVVTRATRLVTTIGTRGPELVGISLGGLQISWSGDGKEIAYTRQTSYKCGDELQYTCSDNDIMVVDAKGGSGIALTGDAHSVSPDFSPDGQWLVFRQENITPYGGLFVMPRSGGSPTLLVGKNDLSGTAFQRFSPDGEQVLFTTQKLGATGSNTDLFLVDVEGGTPYQVSRTTRDELEPSWAPPPFGCTIEITFGIGTSTPLSSVDLQVQYEDAPGAFPGTLEGVQCEEINAVEGIGATFSDLDESGTLTLSLEALSSTPIQGPKDFARCTWVTTSRLPTAEDFDLSTSEAQAFPGPGAVNPQAVLSDIECSGGGTSTTTTTLEPAPLCGDFDGNGKVQTSDALGVLRASVGQVPCLACVCDVDGNGSKSASDALAVLRNAVGQATVLMCSPC